MIVLGIETSCDETSAAVVSDGPTLLGQVLLSQTQHERFGGVVPEIACRVHDLTVVTRGSAVVVCGVRWPFAGTAVGDADPSPENALRFLTEFTTWARLNGVGYVARADDASPAGEEAVDSDETRGLLDETGALQPMEGGVERSFLDDEFAVASCGDPLEHAVTVGRSAGEDLEDEEVERALQEHRVAAVR